MTVHINEIDGADEVADFMHQQRGLGRPEEIGLIEWLRYLFRDYIRLVRKCQSLEEALKIMEES